MISILGTSMHIGNKFFFAFDAMGITGSYYLIYYYKEEVLLKLDGTYCYMIKVHRPNFIPPSPLMTTHCLLLMISAAFSATAYTVL